MALTFTRADHERRFCHPWISGRRSDPGVRSLPRALSRDDKMRLASRGIADTSGMVAAHFEWPAWWFIMLLAMAFVPHYLGTRISTMPEFIKRRFGRRAHTFLS